MCPHGITTHCASNGVRPSNRGQLWAEGRPGFSAQDTLPASGGGARLASGHMRPNLRLTCRRCRAHCRCCTVRFRVGDNERGGPRLQISPRVGQGRSRAGLLVLFQAGFVVGILLQWLLRGSAVKWRIVIIGAVVLGTPFTALYVRSSRRLTRSARGHHRRESPVPDHSCHAGSPGEVMAVFAKSSCREGPSEELVLWVFVYVLDGDSGGNRVPDPSVRYRRAATQLANLLEPIHRCLFARAGPTHRRDGHATS